MANIEPAMLLVVEDDPLVGTLMESSLTEAGFHIVAASDGIQALAELDADATRFKAIVTDIKLGAGPDGWDVGRRAREFVSDVPVIYVSGDSGHDWSSKGVAESVMITKPFAPAQLVTALSTLITSADTNRPPD
jgi:DNA-binding response OmpR family regulator